MTALLRAELLKLRTTRTFVALAATALGLSLLIAVLVTSIGDALDEDDVRAVLTTDASSFFIALLGAIGIAGEWRHRTITSSLLAAPDRMRFLAAKALAYAAAGVLLSLVVTVVISAVAAVILSSRDETMLAFADVLDVVWRNALVAALLGALGVAIGSVVRNQIGALGILIGLAFVVEPTVLALAPEVGRFLPVGGAPAGINLAETGIEEDPGLLDTVPAVLVELGWIAALGALGALLLRRRDL